MATSTIFLEKGNIEAASAALNVLGLFDLQNDTSYPFLDARNWKTHGWSGRKYEFNCQNKTAVAPEDTFKAFGVVAEKMMLRKMGYAVSDSLTKALVTLKIKQEPLGIIPTIAGTIIYIGGPHDVAAESMVFWEVALQMLVLLTQDKSIQVFNLLDKGYHVYLQPPITS